MTPEQEKMLRGIALFDPMKMDQISPSAASMATVDMNLLSSAVAALLAERDELRKEAKSAKVWRKEALSLIDDVKGQAKEQQARADAAEEDLDALLARCEKAEAERDRLHEVAESLYLQYDETCSDRNRMRDERGAALAKLGVVSEAVERAARCLGDGDEDMALYHIDDAHAALASDPEIVAVRNGYTDGHKAYWPNDEPFHDDPIRPLPNRAIFVRRAE